MTRVDIGKLDGQTKCCLVCSVLSNVYSVMHFEPLENGCHTGFYFMLHF